MADRTYAQARSAPPDISRASLQRKCACEETGEKCERCAPRHRLQRVSDAPIATATIPQNMTAREAPRGVSRDFSKIPLFPPDRPQRSQALVDPAAPPIVRDPQRGGKAA